MGSILERGDEIERDFYALKAQEWACEPDEAKRHIVAALMPVMDFFRRRRDDAALQSAHDEWMTAMRTLEEIRRTPVGLLTEAEIGCLDPDGQAFARKFQARKTREAQCSGHERIETATREQANRGWHVGECKHCGKDMSWDSGD